jgi:hypothetical protein
MPATFSAIVVGFGSGFGWACESGDITATAIRSIINRFMQAPRSDWEESKNKKGREERGENQFNSDHLTSVERPLSCDDLWVERGEQRGVCS